MPPSLPFSLNFFGNADIEGYQYETSDAEERTRDRMQPEHARNVTLQDGAERFDITVIDASLPLRTVLFAVGGGGDPSRHLPLLSHRQRMQAIAYWMHHQMGETESGKQTVVSYKALHRELSRHIEKEKPANPDYAPVDLAEAFLEFVKDRAGLLVEIGDRQFSFVHLTFQEYLTARHIQTLSELDGVKDAWRNEIAEHCRAPRWREVVRLLIAGYESDESQEYLVMQILDLNPIDSTSAQLLGGLLLDGVNAAKEHKRHIFKKLIEAAFRTVAVADVKNTLETLRSCLKKSDPQRKTFMDATLQMMDGVPKSKEIRTLIRLIVLAAGLPLERTWQICGSGSDREKAMLARLCGSAQTENSINPIQKDYQFLWIASDLFSLTSISGNFVAVCFLSLVEPLTSVQLFSEKRFFYAILTALSGGGSAGPAFYLSLQSVFFSTTTSHSKYAASLARARARDRDLARTMARARDLARERARTLDLALVQARAQALDLALTLDLPPARDLELARKMDLDLELVRARACALDRDLARALDRDLARALDRVQALVRVPDRDLARDRVLDLVRDRAQEKYLSERNAYSLDHLLFSEPEIVDDILTYLISSLELRPSAQWKEALRETYIPTISKRLLIVQSEWWKSIRDTFRNGAPTE